MRLNHTDTLDESGYEYWMKVDLVTIVQISFIACGNEPPYDNEDFFRSPSHYKNQHKVYNLLVNAMEASKIKTTSAELIKLRPITHYANGGVHPDASLMCKEAQATKDLDKQLSQLDFRFHFFPWHGHKAYRINPDGFDLPTHMRGYFSQLEATLGYPLELAQKAWYIKRAETQGEDMKREFPSTPAEAFEASNEGLYYGRQMVEARQQERIRRVYYDANVPVYTAWDLGYNDSTAIWWYQICGQEIHLLEYYENSGEPLTHYLQLIKSKSYSYGKHMVPHDAAVHEYSTGLSRVEVARNHGVIFTIAPDIALIEGIDACRNILNRCWLMKLLDPFIIVCLHAFP